MALVRWALGKFILFLDWLFSPRPMQRTAEAQRKVEAAVAGLSIYEFRACPLLREGSPVPQVGERRRPA
jgi:hypothetical protein